MLSLGVVGLRSVLSVPVGSEVEFEPSEGLLVFQLLQIASLAQVFRIDNYYVPWPLPPCRSASRRLMSHLPSPLFFLPTSDSR